MSLEYAYVQTVHIVEQVVRRRRAMVYAHDDFGGFPVSGSRLYETPTLLDAIRRDGVDPAGVALLEARIVPAGTGDLPAVEARQGGHRHARAIRARVSVEMVRFSPRTPIVSASGEVDIDPLDALPADPWPVASRLVQALTEAVLDAAETALSLPPPHAAPPFSFYATHHILFELEPPGGTSLERKMAGLDDLGRSMVLLEGYQKFYPDITVLEVERLARTPGLLVTGTTTMAQEEGSLTSGDLVVAVNGRPCLTSHQLDRLFARSRPGDVIRLTVLREGDRKEIALTVAPSGATGQADPPPAVRSGRHERR